MRARLPSLAALSLIVLFAVACSDDDSDNGTAPDVVTISDLIGTWASTAWTFESRASGEEVDMAALGFSVTMVVDENGRYTLTIFSQDQILEIDTGALSLDGAVLIAESDDGGEPALFSFSLDGDIAELMDPAEEYDFDNDGFDEPAILRMTLIRS